MKALFAGSFDPPSWGHYDIIHRALALCDELVIAIAINSGKKPLFTIQERETMLRSMVRKESKKIQVLCFEGLLVDLAKKEEVSVFVRGLRNTVDFEYEKQMAKANLALSGIETVFFMSDEKHAHISSTLIREIIRFGGPIEDFVPPSVADLISENRPLA